MPVKKLSRVPVYVDVKGDGEPLILISGFASGAWNWFAQIDELADNFQVITYDPRGIGKSQANPADDLNDLSMETFVDDVAKILDELGIDKSHVLGASFGGFVAQEFAVRYPERLGRLVLACTGAGGANYVRPSAEILQSFAPDPSLSVGEKVRKFIRPAFTDEFNREHADEVEKVCRMRDENPVDDALYLAQLQVAFTFDSERYLSRIIAPTLVISGDRDLIVPMENSINLSKNIPHAELKIIENGGHLFFIENAAEFNRAVRKFLSEPPASAGRFS